MQLEVIEYLLKCLVFFKFLGSVIPQILSFFSSLWSDVYMSRGAHYMLSWRFQHDYWSSPLAAIAEGQVFHNSHSLFMIEYMSLH